MRFPGANVATVPAMVEDLDRVLRRATRRPLFDASRARACPMDREEVARVLGQPASSVHLDSVAAIDVDEGLAVGHARAPYLGDAISAGLLLAELATELGICLATLAAGGSPECASAGVRFRLLRIRDALFIGEAAAGDDLSVLAMRLDQDGRTTSAAGQVLAPTGVICACAFDIVTLEDRRDARSPRQRPF